MDKQNELLNVQQAVFQLQYCSKELYNSVNKLKIDNRRLKEHLQNQQTAVKEEVAAVTRSLLFNIHFISVYFILQSLH
jgi:hypothetical protein